MRGFINGGLYAHALLKWAARNPWSVFVGVAAAAAGLAEATPGLAEATPGFVSTATTTNVVPKTDDALGSNDFGIKSLAGYPVHHMRDRGLRQSAPVSNKARPVLWFNNWNPNQLAALKRNVGYLGRVGVGVVNIAFATVDAGGTWAGPSAFMEQVLTFAHDTQPTFPVVVGVVGATNNDAFSAALLADPIALANKLVKVWVTDQAAANKRIVDGINFDFEPGDPSQQQLQAYLTFMQEVKRQLVTEHDGRFAYIATRLSISLLVPDPIVQAWQKAMPDFYKQVSAMGLEAQLMTYQFNNALWADGITNYASPTRAQEIPSSVKHLFHPDYTVEQLSMKMAGLLNNDKITLGLSYDQGWTQNVVPNEGYPEETEAMRCGLFGHAGEQSGEPKKLNAGVVALCDKDGYKCSDTPEGMAVLNTQTNDWIGFPGPKAAEFVAGLAQQFYPNGVMVWEASEMPYAALCAAFECTGPGPADPADPAPLATILEVIAGVAFFVIICLSIRRHLNKMSTKEPQSESCQGYEQIGRESVVCIS